MGNDIEHWKFQCSPRTTTFTYRNMKIRKFWKTWEGPFNVEHIQKVRWKISENSIPSPTFRAADMAKDWPPDSNTILVLCFCNGILSQVGNVEGYQTEAWRIGSDCRCDSWTVESEETVGERISPTNVGAHNG